MKILYQVLQLAPWALLVLLFLMVVFCLLNHLSMALDRMSSTESDWKGFVNMIHVIATHAYSLSKFIFLCTFQDDGNFDILLIWTKNSFLRYGYPQYFIVVAVELKQPLANVQLLVNTLNLSLLLHHYFYFICTDFLSQKHTNNFGIKCILINHACRCNLYSDLPRTK